jgi:hypothetical protein
MVTANHQAIEQFATIQTCTVGAFVVCSCPASLGCSCAIDCMRIPTAHVNAPNAGCLGADPSRHAGHTWTKANREKVGPHTMLVN